MVVSGGSHSAAPADASFSARAAAWAGVASTSGKRGGPQSMPRRRIKLLNTATGCAPVPVQASTALTIEESILAKARTLKVGAVR